MVVVRGVAGTPGFRENQGLLCMFATEEDRPLLHGKTHRCENNVGGSTLHTLQSTGSVDSG